MSPGENTASTEARPVPVSAKPTPEDKIMSAPLSTFRSGQVVCESLTGEGPEVVRLKRMGICSGRRIDVIQTGDPMILGVVGTRLGISRKLASRVLVSSAEETATDSPPQ